MLNLINLLGFAIPILVDIFIYIDGFVYNLVDYSIKTFFEVIKFSGGIFTKAAADGMSISSGLTAILSRVMVLAGVFALFRLAIGFVIALTSDDKKDELQKNGSKIAKNAVIAVVALASCSFIFTQMGELGNVIVDSGVVPRIVFGTKNSSEGVNLQQQSKSFANRLFGFFLYDHGGKCANSAYADDSFYNSKECKEYRAFLNGQSGVSSIAYLADDLANFTYWPIAPLVFGILMIYYFIGYALEMAIRALKLAVLQVIAPIPIIMSIDPSHSDKLTKFIKVYGEVWLQAIIRIFTVYMAYALAIIVMETGNAYLKTNNTEVGFIAKIILIIGIFQGAKQIPKLIDDVLGTKFASETQGKGFGKVLGNILGGTIGLVGGGIAGGIAGGAAGGFGNVMSGIATGAASGVLNGAKAGNAKNFFAGAGQAISSIGRGASNSRRVLNSGGIIGYGIGKWDNLTGRNAKIDREATAAGRKVEAYDKFKEAVMKTYRSKNGAGMPALDGDVKYSAAVAARDNYRMGSVFQSDMSKAATKAGYANLAEEKLAQLNADIAREQSRYESDAFKWFQQNKLYDSSGADRTKAIAHDYNDPSVYPTLTDAEKAYYELTRENGGQNLLPTSNSTGNELETQFKAEKGKAATAQQSAVAKQKQDRYLHGNAANGKDS